MPSRSSVLQECPAWSGERADLLAWGRCGGGAARSPARAINLSCIAGGGDVGDAAAATPPVLQHAQSI